MYILYNADGSVNKINLTDYIQKGNNDVNSIFFAIKGKTNSEWAASVYFELPNGEIEGPLTGTPDTQEINGVEYSGWTLNISAAITAYEGLVVFSVSALNLQNATLFTFKSKLVINPSDAIPDETKITVAQYESLVQLYLSIAGDYVTREQLQAVLDGVESELTEVDIGQGV